MNIVSLTGGLNVQSKYDWLFENWTSSIIVYGIQRELNRHPNIQPVKSKILVCSMSQSYVLENGMIVAINLWKTKD